ncbi:uncharacterized protein AB675_9543 [Cyphellophora attinorum]|uniref:CENP-V/GFA domain-containing protein n=1 Tax=Cyphellophora attinorum TaxID=1664694 RepID=A0A0N1HTG3_9EURO|nr:uncharacterized protein AB675_9543 [Phialophora attinorum]KPI42300.1 hypothetical protein AB675_9543 [Phialophora attinorum]
MTDSPSIELLKATISPGSKQDGTDHTLYGPCHCGFVKYTVAFPSSTLQTRTARRCNCTVDLKQGTTYYGLPHSDFSLLSPPSLNDLADYKPKPNGGVHKYFCPTCGVQIAAAGTFAFQGQVREFFQINVGSLDQPQNGLDLGTWKVAYVDGRNDGWEDGARGTPFPGSLP